MNIQQPDKADTSAATKAARKRFFDFIETLHKARSAAYAIRQSSPGMMRRMNSSKSGTVNAVSPWFGL